MSAVTAAELTELARAVENPKPVPGAPEAWGLEYGGRSEVVSRAQLDRLRANLAALQSTPNRATAPVAAANPSAQHAMAQLGAHRAPTGELPPEFAERWLIPELTANRNAWTLHLDNPAIAALLRTNDHIQHAYRDDPDFKAWMKDPSYRPASAPAAPPEVKAAEEKAPRNEPTAMEKQSKVSFAERTTPSQRKAVAEDKHKMQTFIGQHERALLGIGPDLSWEQKALKLLPGYESGETLMDAATGTDMTGREVSQSGKLKSAGKSLALDLLVILQPEEILFEGMGAEGVAAETLETTVAESGLEAGAVEAGLGEAGLGEVGLGEAGAIKEVEASVAEAKPAVTDGPSPSPEAVAEPAAAEEVASSASTKAQTSGPSAQQTTSSPPAAQPLSGANAPGSLDARIAEAEARLNPARQKTLEYQAGRRAEARNLKGGNSKEMWNAKEDIWLLKRQKAYPDRKILAQAEMVGFRTPDGVITESATIAEKGRIVDALEFRGSKTVGTDLKSANEFMNAIKGGVRRPGPIRGQFNPKGKIGAPLAREAKVIAEARKRGGKLVFRGTDVLTGEIETVEVELKDYASDVVTYEDIFPN